MKNLWIFLLASALYCKEPTSSPLTEINIHGVKQARSMPHLGNHKCTLGVSFLFWQANQDGLAFASKATTNPEDLFAIPLSSAVDPQINLTIEEPSFSWEPGVRAEFGGFFNRHDNWDLTIVGTAFWGKGYGKKKSDNISSVMFPTWVPIFLGDRLLEARQKWNLNYYVADFNLGRDYFISRAITLHPFASLRGAYIPQKYRVRYDALVLLDSPPNTAAPAYPSLTFHQTYWGIGPRLGVDGGWHFTKRWLLLGKISGSLLYGHFDVRQKVNAVDSDTAPIPFILRFKTSIYRLRANLEGALGFGYERLWNKDRCRVSLSLLFEASEWFNHNQFSKLETATQFDGANSSLFTQPDSQQGNLGLQGMTASLKFDF